MNGPETAAAGARPAVRAAAAAGDAWLAPLAAAEGVSVTAGSTRRVPTEAGATVARGDVVAVEVPPGGAVSTGVGFGVGGGVGFGVGAGVGVGVAVAHVPAGEAGGGSAPASGS